MNYYYIVKENSNYAINQTYVYSNATYTVYNTEGTGYDVNTFFTDLKSYLATGIFVMEYESGGQNFALTLILFLIMFVGVGVLSYNFGMTSPATIMTIVFMFVYLFDVVLGILPNPVNGIQNFLTIVVGLIGTIMIIMEVRSS
jgi:uncharacterized phage infection (PIP) family protein YhgE